MSARLGAALLLIIILALIVREQMLKRPDQLQLLTTGQVEMCLTCHREEKLDPAHDARTLGCAVCHLGDALAITKEAAHKGIVKNPGDLRVMPKTCGVEGCHPKDVKKVLNSLMATNRGILATLLYYWGETEHQNGDFSVEKLIESGETSLAIDYYRKLCGTCHLWKQRGDLPGFFGEKGGGCTACHRQEGKPATDPEAPKPHPLLSKKVPVENCVRCHNRSGRVGTSYMGIYEAEGYGTPYEDGGLSKKTLPGDRFYLELKQDIHHEKGMACIDCHVRDEIMGDGTSYAHYEEQLEISCQACHTGDPTRLGVTRKNKKMNNVEIKEGQPALVGKLDGRIHPLKPPKSASCDYPAHRRLTCESCHSAWVPQCYGCHAKRDMRDTHLDKLTMKETPGWWEEGRSYLRYEQPMLGVWDQEIVIVTPGCQDIVTLVDDKGQPAGQFNSFTMAALNPHTTQAAGRPCADCHTSPKTLGLGEGTVYKENGQWRFAPIDQGVETAVGRTVGLDSYVDIKGQPLQKSARKTLRPFNGEELIRILRVGQCLPCHDRYDDPAFRNYTPGQRCPVFKEEE